MGGGGGERSTAIVMDAEMVSVNSADSEVKCSNEVWTK